MENVHVHATKTKEQLFICIVELYARLFEYWVYVYLLLKEFKGLLLTKVFLTVSDPYFGDRQWT